MTVVKSILDVEVNDGPFQRYRELFEKYQEEVAKHPAAWVEIGKEIKQVGAEFHDAANALNAITRAQSRSATIGEKQTHQWHSLADSSKKAAEHFASIARSMLRVSTLTGAFTGLLGLGGLFGFDRLAQNASGWRRAAMGLGTTIGGQRAFGLDFNRVVDAGAFLSGVNNALHDVTKRVALTGLGLNPGPGADTATVGVEALQRVKSLVDQTPDQFLGQLLTARRLGDLGLTLQDLERIKATPRAELGSDISAFGFDRRALQLTRQQAVEWQKLQVQLSRAGQSIETTFITGLTPLAPELAKLSSGFQNLVQAFLSNPHMKEWIQDVADGMDHLAKYLHSDRLQADVSWLLDEIERFGTAIGRFVSWAESILGGNGNTTPGAPGGTTQNDGHKSSWLTRTFPGLVPAGHLVIRRGNATTELGRENLPTWLGGNVEVPVPGVPQSVLDKWSRTAKYLAPEQAQTIADAEARKQGVPLWVERLIFRKEGGLNPDGSPKVSRSGAIGFGQLMPRTAMGLHVNPADTAQNARGSVDLMEQIHRAHPDWTWQQVAAAYNWNPAGVSREIAKYGADWAKHLPPETTAYIKGFGGDVHQYAGAAPAPRESAGDRANDHALADALNGIRRSLQQSRGHSGGVRVDIRNNTGGNAVVTAGQLAG